MAAVSSLGTPQSMSLQNQATECGWSCSDFAIQHRLKNILCELECLDLILHSEQCSPPTVQELVLFGLINLNVNLYLQLSQTENLMGGVQNSSKKIKEETSPIIIGDKIHDTAAENDKICDEITLEDVIMEFGTIKDNLDDICCFLMKCRSTSALINSMDSVNLADSEGGECGKMDCQGLTFNDIYAESREGHGSKLQKVGLPGANLALNMDVDSDDHKLERMTAREHRLHKILLELENLGRLRSYAPPTYEDMECYWQMRKRTTSSLSYAQAKVSFCRGAMEGAQKWPEVYQLLYTYTFVYYPKAHRLGSLLDEFLGFVSLFHESQRHIAAYSSAFYGCSVDKFPTSNVWKGKFDVETCKKHEALFLAAKQQSKLELSFPDYLSSNGRTMRYVQMTRKECLINMLFILRKIKSSYCNTTLCVEEVRLLAQIEEHILSSMWLFAVIKIKCPEQKFQARRRRSRVLKSRVDNLQEIVSLVEAVKSSCLTLPPSKTEMRLYEMLRKDVCNIFAKVYTKAFAQGRKRKSHSYSHDDETYAKNLVKLVCRWQLKCLQNVKEEFGKMIELILPFLSEEYIGSVDAFDCFHRHIGKDLQSKIVNKFEEQLSRSPEGNLKMLDAMLVRMEKVKAIPGYFPSTIWSANERLGCLIESSDFTRALEECLSVLQIASRSGCNYGCFNL